MSPFRVPRHRPVHHDTGYHPTHAGQGVGTSIASIVLLTLFSAVVIMPFIYMVSISLQSTSEVGRGEVMPQALRSLVEIRHDLAWIRVELTDEQSAALNKISEIPVVPRVQGTFIGSTVTRLPDESVAGRVLALHKPGIESRFVETLIEVADRGRNFRSGVNATVFYPGEIDGTWKAVSGQIVRRNLQNVLGRLFANYNSLVNWNDLRAGRLFRWLSAGYPRWYFNSLFVAVATVVLGVFFDSLAGFAFAKYEFPLRKPLFALLLGTIMIPYPVTLVPSFFIFAKLGLYNTYAALIVPGLVSAFGIFLVRQYVQGIPDDMLNAARVDGATDFGIYRHVILPTARPVLAALAVFRFIWQWNSYLYPLVLTNRDSMKTVQLGLATLQDHYGLVDHGVQMAGATLAIVPILVVYMFMQRHFIAGITLGSVKD